MSNDDHFTDDECYLDLSEEDLVYVFKKYLLEFESILNQIDNSIDNIDSYEKTVEIKRSIDNLVDTLYSKAASVDINQELKNTKDTNDKSASLKRVKEQKKKQIVEEIISNMLARQNIAKSANSEHTHEKMKNADAHRAKEQMKSMIKITLFSLIAHRMDPVRRAGQTADNNREQAKIHGREAASGVLIGLLKTFLTAVNAVVQEVIKPLKQEDRQDASFVKQLENNRDASIQNGRSV